MSAPDQMASVNGPFRKAALSTVVSTIEPVVAIVFMMESVYLRSGQASVGRRASGFGRWEVDGGRRSVGGGRWAVGGGGRWAVGGGRWGEGGGEGRGATPATGSGLCGRGGGLRACITLTRALKRGRRGQLMGVRT